MANYALIAGNVLETLELYSDVVRREGLEPVLVEDPDDIGAIVSLRGRPKLVLADLEATHDSGFRLLRAVQTAIPAGERPLVVASVSHELRTTAGDLMDALGISEVLPKDADARSVGVVVRRALMQDPPSPTDKCPPPSVEEDPERNRLARVVATVIEDSPPDKALQDLVAQTAEAFGAPVALVSLTLDDGHWFKSHASSSGELSDARSFAFDASFCRYVVETGHPVLVADAKVHPTFAANPLVRSGLVATFAGAPLVTSEGDVLGALCILDTKASAITPARVDVLARFARRVAEEFELRSKARSSALEVIRLNEKLSLEREGHALSKTALAQFEAALSQLDTGVIIVDHEHRIAYANAAMAELLDMTAVRMIGSPRDEVLREGASLYDDAEPFLAKLSSTRTGLKAFSCELEQGRSLSRRVRWSVKPVELPDGIGQIITLVELERNASQSSGRYSVVPPLVSVPTRPARAPRTAKRKA